jgi:hypothetical protein
MRILLLVLLVPVNVARAEPPREHDLAVLGGTGASISSTGGWLLELGVHVRDTVTLSGNATMMGEWYHAAIDARYFPTAGPWRPYLLAGLGELNSQALFEDFISIGVGVEHRSESGHWALFGEAAVDRSYSARRDSMKIPNEANPYGAVGVRYYY